MTPGLRTQNLGSLFQNEPFEGYDSFEVLLDKNDSVNNDSGFFILDFNIDMSMIFLLFRILSMSKIDMSTCRSVQADSTKLFPIKVFNYFLCCFSLGMLIEPR